MAGKYFSEIGGIIGTSHVVNTLEKIDLSTKKADKQLSAGLEGSVVIDKVKKGEDAFGFNAETSTYENLIEAGVIDPTKVVRYALQNAGSVASLMLTTEAMIADKPEENAGGGAAPAMPGGMGGGGMGGMGGMM
jgi:chaperonin GroEL